VVNSLQFSNQCAQLSFFGFLEQHLDFVVVPDPSIKDGVLMMKDSSASSITSLQGEACCFKSRYIRSCAIRLTSVRQYPNGCSAPVGV
jgi:hypothetical protein